MALMTTTDLSEVTGISARVLQDWCERQIIVPVEGGERQGDHRKFTTMQAVGLAVALRLRESERGCVLPYVAEVIEAFGAMDEQQLWKMFSKGQTHLIGVHKGLPLLDGKAYDWVDVRQTYCEVAKAIKKTGQRLQTRGRTRGLAGS